MSVTTVAIKIALNFILIVPLGFLGLALATAAASWLNFALLWRSFLRRTGALWSLADFVAYARILAASLAMGGLSFLTYEAAERILPLPGTMGLVVHLGSAIGVGLLTILPLLHLFHVQEESELSGMVLRMAGKLP
jgi:putative peptidoglycan lipid II flippase